jgi:hypothetical protein
VTKEQGHLVLQDPVTKMSYQFDDQSNAKLYVASNTIRIDRIEPLS